MNSKSSGSTAADLMRDLSSNPEFLRKQQIREEDRQKKAAMLLAAGTPLTLALEDAGFSVESVWDLVNSKKDYSIAIFILRDHLYFSYPKEILEGIARALATPFAAPVRSDLIKLLKSRIDLHGDVRYAVCLAISATTTEENLQETLDLVGDSRLGDCRLGLLPVIKRYRKNILVKVALDRLSNDPVLSIEIKSWK